MTRTRVILISGIVALLVVLGFVWQFVSPSISVFPPSSDMTLNPNLRILFIGNSFTHANNLPELSRHLLLDMPVYEDVAIAMVAPGGYQISYHIEDVLDSRGENPLRTFLLDGDSDVRAWDLVVLQGQSQIMGFPNTQGQKESLVNDLPQLASIIRDNDSSLMLMMTWAYAFGDNSNEEYYPDFLTMSEHLLWGYDDVQQQLAEQNIESYVSPVGLGWQLVYQDSLDNGDDPLADQSQFRRLFTGDNRHPSLAGSYLSANIIVASYIGESTLDNNFVPSGLDTDYASYLRSVAERVVFGDAFGERTYVWNE